MLSHLNIRNLAVIDEVDLEFGPGLTVLTGETGAGKSILVDALALALGERADSRAIRTDTERCEVTATFSVESGNSAIAWLTRNDLNEDQDCILRRIVTADGRSRGYINGHSVPMAQLRELGEQLVDICGQQAHQSLRHAQVQRELLDTFGKHANLLATMSAAYEHWATANQELDVLRSAHNELAARADLLRHETGELAALDPKKDEFAALEQSYQLATNATQIADSVSRALELLYDSEERSAHSTLSRVRRELDDLTVFDPQLAAVTTLLAEAEILASEAAYTLRHHLDDLEHDPVALAEIEQRLGSMHELARKHRIEADALPDLLEQLTGELSTLETGDQRADELAAEVKKYAADMHAAATALSAARRSAADVLAKKVTDNMQKLGMPNGAFAVDLHQAADERHGPNGIDRIEFVAAANPGQAPGPLAKVASGGELSRISLSLQVVALAKNAVPSLIFDEVDAGVGGGVAEIVGGRLRALSEHCQVLCVTHLPQVASQAQHHLRVAKNSDGQSTQTTVEQLDRAARVEEIARMLGGVEITPRTLAHAEEMLGDEKRRKAG